MQLVYSINQSKQSRNNIYNLGNNFIQEELMQNKLQSFM